LNYNGIINIYKEKDYTSFDVVAKLRGILGMRKIGHTGTLDPDATGVLPVCLGKSTKVVELLTASKKTYKAVFETGYETETQDISGTLTKTYDGLSSFHEVKNGLSSFVGDYSQTPPMYSAIRHKGRKLYELAREGIVVERQPRLVHIYEISHIEQIDERHFSFQVTCSKGTYIRTLIYDLGRQLGVGATMCDLERTLVEPFSVKDAITLDQVEALVAEGTVERYILPVDRLFNTYDALVVSTEYEKTVYNGNRLPVELLEAIGIEPKLDLKVRVYDSHKQFIGIYYVALRNGQETLKVKKMFY